MTARVAQLVTELEPGGAERIVYELATGLSKRRFEQLVIAVAPATGEMARRIEEAGVPVRSIDVRREFSPGARGRLERLLREERVDLLHTHLVHADYLGRRAAARGGVKAVVSTVHVPARAWGFKRLLAEALTAKRADATVCVSESARRQYVARVGVDQGTVRVIYNGVDPARFAGPFDREATRRALGLGPSDCVIVSLGRLRPEKGHDVALRALKLLAGTSARGAGSQLPGPGGRAPSRRRSRRFGGAGAFRLIIAGEGPERKRLERLSSRLGLGSCTIFAGQRDDVPEILAASDCLVAASRFEGFGLAVVEGMAAGLPVVASRVDALPEIVEDGVSGLLVEAGDPRAFAEAVRKVLDDRDLALALGRRARERVAERFTLGAMLEAHDTLYAELLRARGIEL